MVERVRVRRLTAAIGLTGALVLGLTGAPSAQAAPKLIEDLKVIPKVAKPGDAAKLSKLTATVKPRRGDKLGQRDRIALNRARAGGQKMVVTLVATERGAAPAVVRQLTALGGTIGYRNDKLGYVRAMMPTRSVERAARLRDVFAVDLNEAVALEPGTSVASTAVQAKAVGPGRSTPVVNPYLPTHETGATTFVRQHPRWDGRNVTIGVLDSGVDLDHPALQKTSTGARKITDWFTATDPLVEGDGTWRAMLTEVKGPSFTIAGRTWKSPAGTFRFNRFSESVTAGDEPNGDVNRDGDTTDTWGVLYRPSDHAIWVDTDQDGDFTDEVLRRPYNQGYQVGHFGTDNPATAVQESMPFVVDYREDVDLAPAGLPGQKADFVNIGIVDGEHGTHVAGIAAGNNLFGGAMDGAAPGAKIVSARACTFTGGCTNVALTEGMIDLVTVRHVDVVNLSIGGLPALNDGNNVRAELYDRLIADYGVQIFISAGNSGPGVNTVGDPSVAGDAVSVAATLSKATAQANYGAKVSAANALFNFSSRGPREDGGLKPDISAPGSAISSIPVWMPGGPVPEAGYDLPPGYAMLNGTSMAAPQSTGAAALLLSAGRAADVPITSAQLRTAIYSSAKFDPKTAAAAQGRGEFRVVQAWSLLRRDAKLVPGRYDISTSVCTPISNFLATPNRGPGIYNRCAASAGGQRAGQSKTYSVTITRRSGPAGSRTHTLRWLGNDGTFSAPTSVKLRRGQATVIKVKAKPTSGAHSAILKINDPATYGTDAYMSAVVIASTNLASPTYQRTVSSRVERFRTKTYFVTVPAGAAALRVNLSGLAAGSQTRFLAFNPYGLGVEDSSSLNCYTNRPVGAPCNPITRTYANPLPGVWELSVESRRTTPNLQNPFSLTAVVQGVKVDPAVTTVASARVGQTVPLSWTLTNQFAPVTVTPRGGPVGSAFTGRPTIADGASDSYDVTVPAGASRLDVSIGNPSDLGADLDLSLYLGDVLVAQDADADAEESVSVANPKAGTYTVVVDGYDVPSGSTAYDYRDVFYAQALGSLVVPTTPITLGRGATAKLAGSITPAAVPAAGRQLYAELTLTEPSGGVVGQAGVVVQRVLPAQGGAAIKTGR